MIIRLDYSVWITGIFYGIFGGLFYYFTEHKERSNYCGVTPFLDWSRITMIVCLVVLAIMTVQFILSICNFVESMLKFWLFLDFLGALAVIVCAIALHVKDAKNCGDLHILAMAFYIIVYIFLALVILFFLYSWIFTKGSSSNSSGSNGYVTVSFTSHTYQSV